MIDIERQIAYWRDSSTEDWQVAQELIAAGHLRHGLFFAHLALEKMLKAHVCRSTTDLAPRLHNLVRLAEIANLGLSHEQIDVLAEMNIFSVEGRYPDAIIPLPSPQEATTYLRRAEEVYRWLKNRLS